MFGINGLEFVALAIIAVLVIGPERLPEYAAQLGRLVKELRRMATGARQQLKDEVGSEFTDVDWQKLDPRQYDPRRIIREALLEDDEEPVKPQSPRPPGSGSSGTAAGWAAGAAAAAASSGSPDSTSGEDEAADASVDIGGTAAGAAATGATAAGAATAAAQAPSSTAAGPGVPNSGPGSPGPWGARRRPVQELPAGEPAPFDVEAT